MAVDGVFFWLAGVGCDGQQRAANDGGGEVQRTTLGTTGSIGERRDNMGGGDGNESMVVAAGIGQGRRRTADNSRQRQWSVAGQQKEEMGRSGVDVVYNMMWWRNKRNYVGGWLELIILFFSPHFYPRFYPLFTRGSKH